LYPEITRRDLQFFQFRVVEFDALRINENGERGCCGHQFVQQFETLGRQLNIEQGKTREIAAGPVKAGNDACVNRIDADLKNDRN